MPISQPCLARPPTPADILLADVQHDPSQLRAYLAGDEGGPLFGLLVAGLLEGSDSGLQEQVRLPASRMLWLQPEVLVPLCARAGAVTGP